MDCPLCNSKITKRLEIVQRIQLQKLYFKLTGESFDYLLNQDLSEIHCEKCGLIFFEPMITGDAAFYSVLQKFDWYYMTDKEEYHYVKQFIKKSDKVLDVGAGKGAFSKLLPTPNFIGLELGNAAGEMAKKIGVHIKNELIQEHADKYPETYDVVCSFQVLEHVSDPFEFIEAQLKALKCNGLLIIAVPSEDTYLKYVVNGTLNLPPHHVTRWSDITLKKIATIFNLELVEIHHEKVQKIHRLSYLETLIQSFILTPKLIDESFFRKLVSKGGNLIAQILIKCLKDEFLPYGHTVIGVYRKK